MSVAEIKGPPIPTIGLCVITDQLSEALADALLLLMAPQHHAFDKLFIQVNGAKSIPKSAQGTLDALPPSRRDVSYFVWNNNFSDARNALQQRVNTDYWVWLDSDDIIQHPERMREVVAYMESEGVSVMMAKYLYKSDPKTGMPLEVQSRERIIKTSVAGKWHGAIHETWIPAESVKRETTEAVNWVHRKSEEEHDQSALRNRKVLEAEFAKDDKDPRIAFYLGLNYMVDQRFESAIKCFLYLIEHGGWDEERYRAWLQIGTAYQLNGDPQLALQSYQSAMLELPSWPDAYFLMQQVYWQQDDHVKALEWFKVGMSKPEPETESARNPVVNQYQPVKFAAYSSLALGDAERALKLLIDLGKQAPGYPIEQELKDAVRQAYNESRAIEAAKYLIDYNETNEADPLAVLESLPPSTRSNVALTDQRRRLIPGKEWPKGSIVFWCGQSFEPWGPDTLDKGMGGSEEAIVQLASHLSQMDQGQTPRHYEVVVYNERKDPTEGGWSGNPVKYLPWTEINPNDEFDVFVAWRNPKELMEIKARVKLCDLHDTLPPELIYQYAPHVDKYMVKSKWQRELYPELPDDKFIIVGNGIDKEQFK